MKINHIGYAVRDIEKARLSFEALGYQFQKLTEDFDRNIAVQFGEKDGYRIELVSPLKGREKGNTPVDTILQTVGNTPYHICYSSSDLKKVIELLEAQKYKVIIPAERAEAFDGRKVVFMLNRTIGIIEIVEES